MVVRHNVLLELFCAMYMPRTFEEIEFTDRHLYLTIDCEKCTLKELATSSRSLGSFDTRLEVQQACNRLAAGASSCACVPKVS